MLKFFGRKKNTNEAEARAMAQSHAILLQRVNRVMRLSGGNAFEVEYDAPAGAGTVSAAALAAKAQMLRTAGSAA